MARKITIGIGWEGNVDWQGLIDRGKLADEAGIYAIWMAEAWGRDAFTPLTLLAEHTRNAQLGTNIVNVYSRTPGALAQHFATLDGLSKGRMIIGLGTSGPNVIEHFHGVKFNPAVTRIEETIDIINTLVAGTPLKYEGKLFKLQRGFTLRFDTYRKHIPIFLGSIKKKSLELAARKADGWLPAMVPTSRLKGAIEDFRAMVKTAGRDPMSVQVNASPQIIITDQPERARNAQANFLAFYSGRMGTFYSEQLTRFGFGDEVQRIKQAWDARDAKAAAAAVSSRMLDDMCYCGGVEGARERIAAHEEAGASLHRVEIATPDPAAFKKTVAALTG
jgi:alkanesulfonate monooxygenase SsuD/methylene tetrahydromethanopterin reductase-like flavin-dependent oxidoreductase (luciferase family)